MQQPAGIAAEIVRITPADLPRVVDMLRRASAEEGGEAALVGNWNAAEFIATGSLGRGLVLAVQADGRLVGYAHLARRQLPQAAIGILALYLLAPFRRQGLGESLLRALLTAAPQQDRIEEARALVPAHAVLDLQPWPSLSPIDEVWLAVNPNNTPALRLYEKLGFAGRQAPPVDWSVPAGFLTMFRATTCRRRPAAALPGR